MHWFIAAFIISFLFFNISAGDIKFSIPKKVKNVPIESISGFPEGKKFNIIYSEDFSGSVSMCLVCGPERKPGIRLSFLNNSKQPYRLNELKINLWTKDDVGHGLEIGEIYFPDSPEGTSVLNPGKRLAVRSMISESIDSSDVKGFTVISSDEENIRFGYSKLGLWDKARWFIAENFSA